MTAPFEIGTGVRHAGFGFGVVEMATPYTVAVRFDEGVKLVAADTLTAVRDIDSALRAGDYDDATATLAKADALAIDGLNGEWGLFSRSRIDLLPHQLWVCRKVTETWPFHWLVADDVGLGKTVECGLVLAPLVSAGTVKRALILCPSSLAEQWRHRMLGMFDLRFASYEAARVGDRVNPFDTTHFLVASAQTVREERHAARLLDAEPWDIVIVDEAHHANVEDHARRTKLFQLLRDMRDEERMESMLLFTGTPHRGKDFGFFSLLSLLRPDLFDPRQPPVEQLPHLRDVMIRNNKANATDLSGKPIFTPVTTREHLFGYTPDEMLFYDTMSAFIEDGLAYADEEGGSRGGARKLVVTTLQKLAASSGAAIGSALRKRRDLLALPPEERHKVRRRSADMDGIDEIRIEDDVDVVADERDRLDTLIALHTAIAGDSKIAALVSLLEALPEDEPVLLFTEYIATQRLVIEALEARFGPGTTGFINGDGRIEEVTTHRGPRTLHSDRAATADAFNAGTLRFLVSTEAAGEGIDLQERCATLVHVDMPWNPMKLHQRVGRLSRFGQKRPVTVHLLRNPDTVDGRIHDLLREKIERIQRAFDASMDEREDMAMLVLGMEGDSFFDALHTDAPKGEGLNEWFDARTGSFGDRSAIETAKAIFGSVDRFDFGKEGGTAPDLDLGSLKPFVERALAVEGRRLKRNEDGTVGFVSPETWRGARMRPRYEGLRFDREGKAETIFAAGNPAFDRLLGDALAREDCVAVVGGLPHPLAIVVTSDTHDAPGARRRESVFGVEMGADETRVLEAGDLLNLLSGLRPKEGPPIRTVTFADLRSAAATIPSAIALPYKTPRLRLVVLLLPGSS